MMLVWNNLADPHLSAFLHFAWFSRTLTLKIGKIGAKRGDSRFGFAFS